MADFTSDDATSTDHLNGLYVPENEHQLRRVQRQGEELDKQVRAWAESVIRVLPRGLPINSHEVYVLSLFLAQQRRLNVQMDSRQPDYSVVGAIKHALSFVFPQEDPAVAATTHHVLAHRLDSEIERACAIYCRDHGVDARSDPALDWRVAIRFMAQSIYSRLAEIEPRKMATSPHRFELSKVARDLATEIETKRREMIAAFPTDPVGPTSPLGTPEAA
ncbi:MAG: hypothetical protein IIA90_08255 [Chloroflexi bacterium]|nr:hypothetical protein [Chloroflexota bacterium]